MRLHSVDLSFISWGTLTIRDFTIRDKTISISNYNDFTYFFQKVYTGGFLSNCPPSQVSVGNEQDCIHNWLISKCMLYEQTNKQTNS